jgi:hypothetical protein
MSAGFRVTASFIVSASTLFALTGCGQQSSRESASQSVPPPVVVDKAPMPVVSGEAAKDEPPSFVEVERDYFPGGTSARRKSPVNQDQPQRILTAGSLNDTKNVDEFLAYVSEARLSGAGSLPDSLAAWDGRRIEIVVRNSEGNPFPDAIVRVFARAEPDDSIPLKYQPNVEAAVPRRLVTTVRTRSDGRTLFLPGIDGNRRDDSWDVEISTVDGELRVRQENLREPAAWWDFTIGSLPSRMPQQLDLALVIDTTGSMGDELEYLKLEISNITARVERLFPGINQRFALILYRDNGDRYVTRNFDFTDSLPDFQQKLNAQHAAGGGDYPEALHAALEQAGELSWRDRNTARVMFLVGDAPPHGRHMQRTFEAVQKLRQRDVAVFPVAGSGTRDEAEFAFRTTAFLTGGQYLFLTDHSGIGLPHAAPHAAEYNVEWLSAVMLRMIASELSGRDVLPSEILGTEETGRHLLAQTVQRHPEAYMHHAEMPWPAPFLNAVSWIEIRPLIALALLFLLAMAERHFAHRPAGRAKHLRRHSGN